MNTGKFFSLMFLVMISFLASCSKGPKSVLEKAEKATFIIYTFDEHGSPAGCGSGFFIDKDGTGITNYHVLDKCMKAVIKLKDGEEYEIDKVIASDKKWDIVKFSILNEDNTVFDYLELSRKAIEQGERVYNLGAPLGLDQTFADGLVSSIRTDSHGDVAQVTIPISQGSSGSPIMNEYGDVAAVATFKQSRGENLNFGVFISEERLMMMNENPFIRDNRQFNNKEGFIILNIPSDQDNDLVLNAIQFKKGATIAYLSYTNLDMSMNRSMIWCTTGLEDEGFYIINNDNGRKFYVVSSSIGANHENGTSVPLATVCKFQINFPPIDKDINNITLSEGGNPQWTFSNINLEEYKKTVKIDFEGYQKEYAYSTMHEGQLEQAQAIFEDILDDDPENIQALNAMGIISYVIDNNQDAIKYFTEVIDNFPNSTTGYLNRSCVYKYQGNKEKAIEDITKAINIDSDNPELFLNRSDLYVSLEKWDKAKDDIDKAIECKNAESDIDLCLAYYKRGLCEVLLGDKGTAENTLKKALTFSPSIEMRDVILTALDKISPEPIYTPNSSANYAVSYFRGVIGSFPITLYLKVTDDGNARGWYYYDNKGSSKKLSLSGMFNESGDIIMNEYDENGNNTGKFDGSYSNGVYKGIFHAYGNSQSYEFYLNEI